MSASWKPKRDVSRYAMQCASLMQPPSAQCVPLRARARGAPRLGAVQPLRCARRGAPGRSGPALPRV